MRKMIWICLAALMMLALFAGCTPSATEPVDIPADAPTGKVVVNFEGIVAETDGKKVTLETGKIIVITDDTVFAGDPDTGNAVSAEIAVGNFIQGYTADDPEAETITAAKVYANYAVRSGGKLAVSFEGRITAVEDGCVTLEDGTRVLIADETVFSVPSGVVESAVLTEGRYIQGSTADDPDAAELTASRIHLTAL